MPFELNCKYDPEVSYKEDFYPRSQSKIAEELSSELRSLIATCQQNLYHAQ